MKKILINGLAYVDGRAAGFNNYFQNILKSFISELPGDFKLTLLIRSDQSQHFKEYSNLITIKEFKCRNLFERVIKENLFIPVISYFYSVTVFPGNISPFWMLGQYLLIVCDLNFTKFPKNFSRTHLLLRKAFQRMSLRSAKVCVAISKEVRDEILNFSGVESEVIYVPIDAGNIKRHDYHSETRTRLIVIPSSLAVHKNVAAAYEAAIKIANEVGGIDFVFFGGWKVEAFPASFPHENIRLLGWVDSQTRDELYGQCDAVLVPSIYEGFGMPYAEALMLGIPLVCCDIPIAREIVGPYPYYIEFPYDDIKIADALRSLVTNKFCALKVAHTELPNYSIGAAGKKYIDLMKTF